MNKALLSLLPVGGWSPERLGELDITGALDPVLPTPFRITETSVAMLWAVGLAASDLWELRNGRPPADRLEHAPCHCLTAQHRLYLGR